MKEIEARRAVNRCPTHPGAILREAIEATAHSKSEIARTLGISRQHLYDLMEERKPVSPTIAAKLGKLFGNGAGFWIRLQGAHDAWQVERSVDTSNIPNLVSA